MNDLIISTLRSALSKAGLYGRDVTLLAAVSGGLDSVALLHGLAMLRPEMAFTLCAAHVEHGLRAEDSRGDEVFVRELCGQLRVKLRVYHVKLGGSMADSGIEEKAREARRDCFLQAMEDFQADAVLTGHHLDDQAETLLMRLLRGAGAHGLAGMRGRTVFGGGILLRPFLGIPKALLARALADAGYAWREDLSNTLPCCLRNRIRLDIIPRLALLQPKAAEHMAQSAERMQWDEECLGALAEDLLSRAKFPWPSAQALRLQALLDAPKAVALRALRRWVEEGLNGGAFRVNHEGIPACPPGERSLSFENTIKLYNLMFLGGRQSLNMPANLRIIRTERFLHMDYQDKPALAPADGLGPVDICRDERCYHFGTLCFTLSQASTGEAPPNGQTQVSLPGESLVDGVCLRTPLQGDRMHPFGAKGGKTLRRYFIDRKIDRAFRQAWPVVAMGSDILWVAGIGASEKTRLLPEKADRAWILTVHGELPL